MDKIKAYILRHPNRVKYGLILANVFAILIAVRMYINYIAIEDAIQETIEQSQNKELELAFTENFLLNYEQSEYAQYFLQHENNILSRGEYIIKFEALPEKSQEDDKNNNTLSQYDQKQYIKTPQESWNHFIEEKVSKIR
ncbi:hypothetical protein KKG31_03335 [Patescibacteria group bacterium]|nr:hypothetical protein [Patescibacteria group bacterium]